MDLLFKPEKLNINSDSSSATQDWEHWYKTFLNFLQVTQVKEDDKLKLLTNFVSPSTYVYINECLTFTDAINNLKGMYCKPVNEVFARHALLTRKQQPGESIDQFMNALKILSKNCNFKAVTAETNRDDCMRDAFVNGLMSPNFRQRLLENMKLSLTEAYEQARSLESAQQNSMSYQESTQPTLNQISENKKYEQATPIQDHPTIAVTKLKCFFCGYDKHNRNVCPARDCTCKGCGKKGHFISVCKSQLKSYPKLSSDRNISSLNSISLNECIAAVHPGLTKATVMVYVNDVPTTALIDTGSSSSFINETLVKRMQIKVTRTKIGEVSMASNTLSTKTLGECKVTLKLLGNVYHSLSLSILPNLCTDVIIGHDLLSRHSKLEMNLGGIDTPLEICNLAAVKVKPASLFAHLSTNCRPVAIKSRRYSFYESKFIASEVDRLLKEEIIEPSRSPWRAQVVVTTSANHKRRMVIDYSQTINRFTRLDAYPLPRIEEIVNQVANYSMYSVIDLTSAYHQVPIREEDKIYTAFEANGGLYQFKRIPFGVTNGVAAFQRVMDELIRNEGLTDTFAYIDDVTVCGKTKEEHDQNLKKFLEVVKKYGITINEDKSVFSVQSISFLGYIISNGAIKPDPERLSPLKDLPPPSSTASLKRTVGMFSHFSKFIPKFSEKIRVLTQTSFPLSKQAAIAFNDLKREIEQATLYPISDALPFTVETDASDSIIAATLSQDGRPVAFFSRGLNNSELRHSSVEKEAYAIVEAVRKWRHFLLGRHFKLITDQKSVSFMFHTQISSKIKNEKIMRWRLELSCYSYDIVYRPGKDNLAADTLTRVCLSMTDKLDQLKRLHESLCHPGETRLYHWTRSKNLPFTLDEIRKVTSSCKTCAEVKPRFFSHQGKLIKSTSPFERLNLDFKGPLPSCSRNRYMLTVVDEFSRFPFAFGCPDLSAFTIIEKLKQLFSTFGTPAFIHSDRGASFMSQELKQYLTNNGIATSRTTPYNPQGNGQVERYNGIIWKTVELALKNRQLDISKWEKVLDESLHSIRSLLCTTTNCTPHERMFSHPRRSSNGMSTPSWLMTPGVVLMRRHVRSSKYEPLVDNVTLLDGNAEYAHVRLPDGRETTVSTRHLAPAGQPFSSELPYDNPFQQSDISVQSGKDQIIGETIPQDEYHVTEQQRQKKDNDATPQFHNGRPSLDEPAQPPFQTRHSTRIRNLPVHLRDYDLN